MTEGMQKALRDVARFTGVEPVLARLVGRLNDWLERREAERMRRRNGRS